MKVIVVGAGVGGLVLALQLHQLGIEARVYEAVEDIRPVGVGINLLPHATQVLAGLDLEKPLAETGVTTRESVFFTRFGQLVYREPAGRFAGYAHPQFSIHRGDLQAVLLDATRRRLGERAVVLGRRCTAVEQDERGAVVTLVTPDERIVQDHADLIVGCDGVHSTVRRQFHPDEGEPVYSGVNMWRGVTEWPPFLSGASMVRAGWLDTGKLVIYPIRPAAENGEQLVNWVAEVETPRHSDRDWNRRGRLEDFLGHFADWHFDWLDIPAMLQATHAVLEYPMVDQEPLTHWGAGRVTLLGDAAHPMVPRGSNGAGQAILDARSLAGHLLRTGDAATAAAAYEAERIPATGRVVRANRAVPPDVILLEAKRRTGDAPFDDIAAVLPPHEAEALSRRYKEIAGYTREALGEA
jgi:2-polyprenyl-6-methoxyphenol hydroxylase-like FAD-dependent oxidoreductase